MLWLIDSCQSKVFADQYHVTLSQAQIKSSPRSRVSSWNVAIYISSECRLHRETNDNTLNYCIYHNEQQQPFPRYKFMFHHFGFVSWKFSSQSTTLKFPIWTDHKICPSNWASTVTGLIWRGPQNPTICAISKLVNVESMQSRCKTLHFTSNLAHISIL